MPRFRWAFDQDEVRKLRDLPKLAGEFSQSNGRRQKAEGKHGEGEAHDYAISLTPRPLLFALRRLLIGPEDFQVRDAIVD